METKEKLYSTFLALTAMILLLILISSTASASITEEQITADLSNSENPAIYGNKIVWQDNRNGNADIYIYDLSTGKEIHTNNLSDQINPAIYENNLVWEDKRNGGSDIYLEDLSTKVQTRIPTTGLAFTPDIYGNRILYVKGAYNEWQSWYELYMYDFSAKKETQIPTIDSSIMPAIYGNRIVWVDHDTWDDNGDDFIYMYDVPTKTQTQIAKGNYSTDEIVDMPDIYGDRIVYEVYSNGNWDICMYNLSTNTETQITINASDSRNPVIYGNSMVWQDNRNGNWDIYVYDLSTNNETQITTNASDQVEPAIYDNKIVWTDSRNGNLDIYMGIITEDTIVPNPPEAVLPIANFNVNSTSGYVPLTVQFTDTSQNATSRIWDVNNDGIEDSKEASFVYTYTSAGTYTAKLTAINENGTTSKADTITVLEESTSGDNSGESNNDSNNNDSNNGENTSGDSGDSSSSGSSGGSSHSSGSGGGGGTGGSPEPQRNVEYKDTAKVFVPNEKQVTFNFTNNVTTVNSISFTSKKTMGKITALTEDLKSQSSLVKDLPEGIVYKSFNVWVGNAGYGESDNILNATMDFKVEKSWIQENDIDPSSITLYRYDSKNEKWIKLEATQVNEDNEYLYFTAETSGFSSFVIVGDKEDPTLTAEHAGESVGGEVRSADNGTTVTKGTPESPGFGIISGVVCLLGLFLYRRR